MKRFSERWNEDVGGVKRNEVAGGFEINRDADKKINRKSPSDLQNPMRRLGKGCRYCPNIGAEQSLSMHTVEETTSIFLCEAPPINRPSVPPKREPDFSFRL